MDDQQLEEIMLRWSPDELYQEDGEWHACTEWLVGTFSGRSFVSEDKDQALAKMCQYFDQEKGNGTMVGDIVEKMGWPNLDIVYQHLFMEGE